MLKSAKLNKKYILSLLSIGLFGLGGLLLAPATMYIIKVSDNHPKVFRWIIVTAFIVAGVYGLLFERKWNTSFAIIYIAIVIAVSSMVNTKTKQCGRYGNFRNDKSGESKKRNDATGSGGFRVCYQADDFKMGAGKKRTR